MEDRNDTMAKLEAERERVGGLLVDLAVKTGREKGELDSTSKSSFSIPLLAHLFIKSLSKNTQIKQADIVTIAPLIFKVIAEKSLERRKQALDSIQTLQEQIENSFAAMKIVAPHLCNHIDLLISDLDELISDENSSIDEKNYSGINTSHTSWSTYEWWRKIPAYLHDLEDFLSQNTEALAIASLFVDGMGEHLGFDKEE